MKILVTAGPTREFLDDVRFLSNPSTGRMGFACAAEARRRGHRVTLIAGPVELPPPEGVEVVRVVSALEMARETWRRFARCDALIMTAAVSDYRPARRARGKIKKSASRVRIGLVRNPDIVGRLGPRKGRRVIAGFAVESARLDEFAAGKMRRKRLDLIVANPPAAFGADRVDAVLLRPDGSRRALKGADKRSIARAVLDEIERRVVRSGRG